MVVTHQPITVLLADPSDVSRFGLRTLLQADPRFSVVGDVPADIIGAAQRLQPDLIIFDPASRGELNLQLIDELHRVAPTARLAIFTSFFEPHAFMAAMLKRVHGYLMKDAGGQGTLLLDAIALTARFGVVVVDAPIAQHFCSYPGTPIVIQMPGSSTPRPTERELQVLQGLGAGLTEHRIAALQGMSPRSVRRLIANLEANLRAPSLFTLGAKAAQLGLIP